MPRARPSLPGPLGHRGAGEGPFSGLTFQTSLLPAHPPPPTTEPPAPPAQGGRENSGQGRGPFGVSGCHPTTCVLWKLDWGGLTPCRGSGPGGREPGPRRLGAATDGSGQVTAGWAQLVSASCRPPPTAQVRAAGDWLLAQRGLVCAKGPGCVCVGGGTTGPLSCLGAGRALPEGAEPPLTAASPGLLLSFPPWAPSSSGVSHPHSRAQGTLLFRKCWAKIKLSLLGTLPGEWIKVAASPGKGPGGRPGSCNQETEGPASRGSAARDGQGQQGLLFSPGPAPLRPRDLGRGCSGPWTPHL